MKLVMAPMTQQHERRVAGQVDEVVGERAGEPGHQQRADEEADAEQDRGELDQRAPGGGDELDEACASSCGAAAAPD